MKDIVTEPLVFDFYYLIKSAVEIQFGSINRKLILPKVIEITPIFRNSKKK
jgi:hypothetical protein